MALLDEQEANDMVTPHLVPDQTFYVDVLPALDLEGVYLFPPIALNHSSCRAMCDDSRFPALGGADGESGAAAAVHVLPLQLRAVAGHQEQDLAVRLYASNIDSRPASLPSLEFGAVSAL